MLHLVNRTVIPPQPQVLPIIYKNIANNENVSQNLYQQTTSICISESRASVKLSCLWCLFAQLTVIYLNSLIQLHQSQPYRRHHHHHQRQTVLACVLLSGQFAD